MATYTTIASLKTELPAQYNVLGNLKLTEDGWINAAGNFNETGFLTQFITRTAQFMEAYLSSMYTAPLQQCGLTETINRMLAAYEIEVYLQGAQSNRGVNITIYTQRKEAIAWMDKILKGEVELVPDDVAPYQNTVRLIEDDCDDTINLCSVDQNILFSTTSPMDEDCSCL